MIRKNFTETSIRLRGVRQNNLKSIDLDLPKRRLVVITGLSGSGKSSLAFETLFAEGQRRYIETFSPYARQFLDRMDKPQVDSIEGIPPAIAIEQRNSVKSTRSTVGTMTEICDYSKLFWARLAQLYCRNCGKPVRKESPGRIWDLLIAGHRGAEALITFQLALSARFPLREAFSLIERQGYQRLLVENEIIRIEQALDRAQELNPSELTVIQDRLAVTQENRARCVEACEQSYHFGQGKLAVRLLTDGRVNSSQIRQFSDKFHCAECDIEYREPSSALFSFNHPIGACPRCRGFGRIIAINYDAAIPDRTRTLAGGAVKPWQTGTSAECQKDMARFARIRKAPMNVPFEDLPKKWQDWVIDGDPGYGSDKEHEWPKAWYGVKGYFRWLESKSYKMHVRVLLSRYRIYQTCPDCHGARFQPEALLYRLGPGNGLTLAEFYRLPLTGALEFLQSLLVSASSGTDVGQLSAARNPWVLALNEVSSRIEYLIEAGLGYLSLDRNTRSLSGGETERVNLTTCLGSRLVNTLFVLDEPSVGLHSRDTDRLIRILHRLRDAGNSVVVVEHEAEVMRAADQIIDLGPGHGEAGGRIVFQGTYQEVLSAPESLTGQYLSGAKKIEIPVRRPFPAEVMVLRHANLHNLKDVTARIPLGRFVCVTGVSGSGKTTLLREVLLPALEARLKQAPQLRQSRDVEETTDEDEETTAAGTTGLAEVGGWQKIGQVVLVDQSALGKTPRSNPAVYIGAFDEIRALFAQTDVAKQRGLSASAFSFNSAQGQCERCRGAGFEKIEMQFLSDVFIRCPDCEGRRYRPHILEVKLSSPSCAKSWSIADLLEATVDEVIEFLGGLRSDGGAVKQVGVHGAGGSGKRQAGGLPYKGLPHKNVTSERLAERAIESLSLLQEVGLGYLRLGQSINTLSGGESQRLKLVSHLAAVRGIGDAVTNKSILFLLDEPTTGLHFDDIRVLLGVFQRLVDAGHSVVVIEHNLDVIKSADWVIDLGPEGGDGGGKIVAEGTPEQIAAFTGSHTGQALKSRAGIASRKLASFPLQ